MQPYLHGSEPPEQGRLSNLNDLLNQACLRELGLRRGETVLDVGCGLGQFTRAMARAVGPQGRVVGVERDPNQLAEASRQALATGESDLVEWRVGEAQRLPLNASELGAFDVVHARFVLEHVSDPEQVVRQMAGAVRPGGRVILADDDHQVFRAWPEPAGLPELWQAYMAAYQHLGCDPFIGRRLVELLSEAGLEPRRNHWVFFGSCAGQPEFPAFVQNAIGVVETARDLITGSLGFGQVRFDEALANFREWGARRDAAIWYALCWAEGVRNDA